MFANLWCGGLGIRPDARVRDNQPQESFNLSRIK